MLRRNITVASAEPSASTLTAYQKINWQNGYNEANPDNNTPLNSENLNHMDIGIYNVTAETIDIRDNKLNATKSAAKDEALLQVASNISDGTYSSRYYIEEEQPDAELAENIKHIATEIAAAKLMVDILRGDDEEKVLTVAGINTALNNLRGDVGTNSNTLSKYAENITVISEDLETTNSKLETVEDYLIRSSSVTAKDNMNNDLAAGYYIYSFSADRPETTRDENGNITPEEYSYTAATAPILKTIEGEFDQENHVLSILKLEDGSISQEGFYLNEADYIKYLVDRIAALEAAASITPSTYEEWKDNV